MSSSQKRHSYLFDWLDGEENVHIVRTPSDAVPWSVTVDGKVWGIGMDMLAALKSAYVNTHQHQFTQDDTHRADA